MGKWVDDHCAGSWADVKAASQAQDYAKAKVKLALKSGGDTKKGKGTADINDLGPGGTMPASGSAIA